MPSVTQVTPPRYVLIDVLRACALALMIAFHFCFDLSFFGLADFDFYRDTFWLDARTFILSSFLLLVGVGLRLAHGGGVRPAKAVRRSAVIGANAALVSAATYAMFGDRWIFFGVLHFIALASLIVLPFVCRPVLALLAGGLALLAGQVALPAFDRPWLQWVGFMTHKPATEDYVPLIPWLGVVLLGIVVAPAVRGLGERWTRPGALARGFAAAGRRSLLIYMLHQPLLIGALKLFVVLRSAYNPAP